MFLFLLLVPVVSNISLFHILDISLEAQFQHLFELFQFDLALCFHKNLSEHCPPMVQLHTIQIKEELLEMLYCKIIKC